ncbi:PilZ domain-containing protein [Sphingobium sp. BYY-5]|uniref:PilZ domain-containing protein n=1 Tax=Sphingobium sp. BYY-5 TaxID=2926400 RepID=UPI001FA6F19B|nr:PilZ domain-containing protein [Sphingobium sp. BYY-5]MCI4589922.1 PilZ domain-containing protein [Sphingobium sp. BYY-5]
MDDEQGISDRGPARAAPRDSLFLLTNLCTSDGAPLGKARIRNLSATGLMADCEGAVAVGARIALDLRGVGRVSGRVVWSRENKIGVAFDEAIDPQLARKPVASDASQRMSDYLRLHQPPTWRR